MRLHRLTLTAFGPFAETERIDFDQLAQGGLFLLRGATGAGKSSVLDAVCFALYGEVPGARKGNPLRSDHAAPGRLTEVCLEVTLGGRRLEITRRPEQQRPKLRGAGSTTEKAQTLLREWVADAGEGAPGWRAASRSHQEAGEEIRRLIGMSRDQFCQVVLLPQGDFARFLRADAAQRAELLRRLFDTERFEQVEGWLGEQRRLGQAEVQQGVVSLRDLASKAEQAAGPGAAPLADWAPEGAGELAAGLLAWAAILRGTAAEQLAIARSATAIAEAGFESARARQRAAEELADRQRRHRAAVEQAARLVAAAPSLTRDQLVLTAAQSAAAVEPVLRLRDSAAAAHRSAAETERSRRAALEPQLEPRLGRSGAEELAEAERRLRAELGRLAAAEADERRHMELGAVIERLGPEQRRAEELAEEIHDWLLEFEESFAKLQQEQAAARAAESEVERLDERRSELAARLSAAERRDGLRTEIAEAEQNVLARRGRAQDARERALELRERRLAGMAAELAGQLQPGEACRVCGSDVHPAPARPTGSPVRAEDEERARTEQQRTEQEASAAEQTLAALRVEEAAAATASGTRSVAELRAEADSVAASRRAALRAADGLGLLNRRLTDLSQRQSAQQDRLREAGERAATAAARRRSAAEERTALDQRLAEARGAAPSVAARAAELGSLAQAVAATLTAVRAADEAADRLARADAELAEATRAAGFDSPAQARQAIRPADERAALAARLARHRSELDAAEAQLAEPELVSAAARPAADPGTAQAATRAATERLRTASATESAADRRRTELASLSTQLAELAAQLAPALDHYGRISRLVELVTGNPRENTLRMRLESYVLAARLERVAAAASERLVRMSGGRYTLVHSDDRVSGNKRSGLSLHVVDAWTGVARDTATLSGGESFFASLALALGLADVVTDEAGGMPLDTLFIDEGFGSLDEHTLEEVMDVLDGLRERDRAVGIVSHVADLRTRIPSQLLVEKGRHGSTLRLAGRAAD